MLSRLSCRGGKFRTAGRTNTVLGCVGLGPINFVEQGAAAAFDCDRGNRQRWSVDIGYAGEESRRCNGVRRIFLALGQIDERSDRRRIRHGDSRLIRVEYADLDRYRRRTDIGGQRDYEVLARQLSGFKESEVGFLLAKIPLDIAV